MMVQYNGPQSLLLYTSQTKLHCNKEYIHIYYKNINAPLYLLLVLLQILVRLISSISQTVHAMHCLMLTNVHSTLAFSHLLAFSYFFAIFCAISNHEMCVYVCTYTHTYIHAYPYTYMQISHPLFTHYMLNKKL